MQEKIKEIKVSLDNAGINYRSIIPLYKRDGEYYKKVPIVSKTNFNSTMKEDTRVIFFMGNPTLRNNITISERSILADVIFPWEIENDIVNIGEMMDSPLTSLKSIIPFEKYNDLISEYNKDSIVRDITYNIRTYRKFLKSNTNIITSYNIKEFLKTGDVAMNDLKGKLRSYIISMDNDDAQRLITRLYKEKMPRVVKLTSKYMYMHIPRSINNLVLCRLGMCTYTYNGKVGITHVKNVGDIEVWLEAYQILMTGSIPRESKYVNCRKYFRNEVGDDIFREIQDIFDSKKEIKIIL